MKVYRLYDDEYEEIMGEQQLCNFAVSQVHNCQDDFLEENLKMIFEDYKSIVEIAENILYKNALPTVEQAETILHVRCFDLEELEVY